VQGCAPGDRLTTRGGVFKRARNKVLRYLCDHGAIASTASACPGGIAKAAGLDPGDFQALWDLLMRARLVEGTGSGPTRNGWVSPSGFGEAGGLAEKGEK
jgi:hypothetical protein